VMAAKEHGWWKDGLHLTVTLDDTVKGEAAALYEGFDHPMQAVEGLLQQIDALMKTYCPREEDDDPS
jgi:hypothetical protein